MESDPSLKMKPFVTLPLGHHISISIICSFPNMHPQILSGSIAHILHQGRIRVVAFIYIAQFL